MSGVRSPRTYGSHTGTRSGCTPSAPSPDSRVAQLRNSPPAFDGPPHSHWYELKRCREIMAELSEPDPKLPPFDPSTIKLIPHEAEIRVFIVEFYRTRQQ